MRRMCLPGCMTVAALVFLGVSVDSDSSESARSITYPTRTMGTYARVVLVVPDSAASSPYANAVHTTFARVDSLMSNWTDISEVARLNRETAPRSTPVHPEVAAVLATSIQIWGESQGAFDITIEPLVRAWGFIGGDPRVPSDEEAKAAYERVGCDKLEFDEASRSLKINEEGVRIDLGGIAKGYAVDVGTDTLVAHGIKNALIDVAGNMYALGHPADSEHWRIGIRDPRDRLPFFSRLQVTNQAVATSGIYEQFVSADGKTYGHILDPRSGRPAEGLISVTVVAPTAMMADAWGTALFVLGPKDAITTLKKRDDLAAVLVEPGAEGMDVVWVEESLRDQFKLEDRATEMFRVEFY